MGRRKDESSRDREGLCSRTGDRKGARGTKKRGQRRVVDNQIRQPKRNDHWGRSCERIQRRVSREDSREICSTRAFPCNHITFMTLRDFWTSDPSTNEP